MKKWVGIIFIIAIAFGCTEEKSKAELIEDLKHERELLIEADEQLEDLDQTIRYNDSIIKIFTTDSTEIDIHNDSLLLIK